MDSHLCTFPQLTAGIAAHKHAVASLTNGNSFTYDANGNMITRHVLEGTVYQDYILNYDAENRLVEVKKNGNIAAQFTYDADGKRVKSVMGTDTILFVGAHYEVKNGSEITNYYLAGTTRIAMRTYTVPQNNMTLTYLMSDHLNSTSLTTDGNGAKVLELRYKAWGEVRATWTANPTTTPAYKSPAYTYTGQYSYMDDPATSGTTEGFGLMFYNARWYDPALGRFAQADTMVPGGVQGLDRYAYVNNSPLNYVDPSGHCKGDPDDRHHWDYACWKKLEMIENKFSNITVGDPEEWSLSELKVLSSVLYHALAKFHGSHQVFQEMFGKVTFYIADYIEDENGNEIKNAYGQTDCSKGGCTIDLTHLSFIDEYIQNIYGTFEWTIAHELGHVYDARWNYKPTNEYDDKFDPGIYIFGFHIGGNCTGMTDYGCQGGEGFAETFAALIVSDPNNVISQERENFLVSLLHQIWK